MIRSIAILTLSFTLCSCASVIWVKKGSESSPTTVPGVPFFVKKQQFKQISVYSKSWLRATLTVEQKLADDKTGAFVSMGSGKEVYVRDIPKTTAILLDEFKTAILGSENATTDDAVALIKKFNAIGTLTDEKTIVPTLLKNAIDPEWVVDPSTTYYLNAPLPWFGTGTLSQELNADGTLSKASSTADTKAAEAISTLLPIKEFLAGKFVKPAAAVAADSTTTSMMEALSALKFERQNVKLKETKHIYVLSLEIVEVGHQYSLTKVLATAPTIAEAIPFNEFEENKVTFEMKDLGAPDKEDKKSGSKVGIEGSVTFPKDWNAPAKTDKK